MMRAFALLFAALAGLAAANDARAQTAEEFYEDKQITELVSTAASGGYDTYAPEDVVAAAAKLVP